MPSPKIVRHLVAPGYEQARGLPLSGETIDQFITRMEWDFKIPTVCATAGQPILRAEWDTYPMDLGEIVFLSRPHGGGGGSSKMAQVAGIVGVIALAAIAPWAASGLAPYLGITSSIGISALAGGISLGGAFLLSTLIKVSPGGQTADALADASQVYSLTATGNTGRPLDCIPVNYGTIKILPDYGSSAWSEYISNDQYLNLFLVVGVGKHLIRQLLIDDTILWDKDTGLNPAFTDVTIEFYNPGDNVTLFPTNIQQTSEVNNLQLVGPSDPSGGWAGGFIANDSGTICYKLMVDVGLPTGLFQTDADGNPQQASVTFEIQGRRVSNAGTPLEGFTPLSTTTITNMTRTPQRQSIAIDVTPARWEIRLRRTTEPQGGVTDTVQQTGQATVVDQAVWLGLRAYIEGGSTYDHEQTIGIRMKADSQLSAQSSRQIGVICTRILPLWNGSEFVETPTNNPFWAFLDAATSTEYGARRPLSKMDFQTIFDLATTADERGDSFNYSFRSFVTVPAAFDTILAAGRSKHCWIGDILSVVRDEWKPIPSMLLTDNQIVRGSLEVTSIFNDETGVDCVIGEFLNESTWRPSEVQYPPNGDGFQGTTPSRLRIDGVTNSDQMYREIAFMYRQSQLRRTKVSLSTEHDGRMLRLLSAVKVQSHLPRNWGLAGEVRSSLGNVLTTSIDFPDYGETTYIELRDKRGRYFGPVICYGGDTSKKITLDPDDLATVETQQGMTLANALDRMDGAEAPAFVVGKAGNMSRDCIVLSGKPNGDKVDLTLVIDTSEVHGDDDIGTPALPPAKPLTANPAIPVVAFLNAVFRLGIAEPMIDASWWPAPGAIGYRAQISYNNGVNWKTVYEGIQPSFSAIPVEPLAIRVRVSAYNNVQGPWSSVDIDPPDVIIRYNTVNPASMVLGLHDYVMNQLKDTSAALKAIQQIISSAAADADAAAFLSTDNLSGVVSKQIIKINSSFAEVDANLDGIDDNIGVIESNIITTNTTVTSLQNAFASYSVTTNAALGAANTQISITQQSLATLTASMSQQITQINANITGNTSSINNTSTALASLTQTYAQQVITYDAAIAGNTANITSTTTALANLTQAQTIQNNAFTASIGANTSSITTNATAIANANTAISSLTTSTSASIGSLNTSVSVVQSSVVTLNNQVASQWGVTINVNGYVTGINTINGGQGISGFIITADKFLIQLPGYNGSVPQPVFSVGTISGVPSLGFAGNMYLDGVVNARSLNVVTLSSLTGNVGVLTSGRIQSADGKMVIDLDARSIVFYD